MKHKYTRLILYGVFFLLTFFVVYQALITHVPDLWQAVTSGNEADIERFLADADRATGLIFLGVLQVLQVLSIVIPSAPIQIAGGMVYGAVRAYLVCQTMYVAANVAVITAVRKFSGLGEIIGESEQARVQKVVRTLNTGDPFVTVMLLCLVPLVPNGIIPYAASQMDMRIKTFALAVFVGSIYPILSLVLAGKFLVSGEYVISILLIVLNITILLIVYRHREHISVFLTDRVRNKN